MRARGLGVWLRASLDTPHESCRIRSSPEEGLVGINYMLRFYYEFSYDCAKILVGLQ